MKKIILCMMAAIAATLMLTGCGAGPADGLTEPAPPAVVEPAPPVVVETAPTAPAEVQYEFGDLVYSLETWPDGTVHVCRHAVVEHAGDVVIVTMAIGETAEDIRWGLPMALESWAEMDPGEYLEQIDADALYSSERAAQEAADELMSGR